MRTYIIFGGTGFIGSFFAEQILSKNEADRVILADLLPIDEERFGRILQPYIDTGTLEYFFCDVRKPISKQLKRLANISLIANFAAIHREPGHQLHEFYETNLLGAENVCQWASELGCEDIVFTSSIAPYGPSESPRTEQDLPLPVTPYGSSKLVAEKIHLAWQQACPEERNLTIVRPGVVFGPGEGGNVSRLIKATLKGYFFYMSNKNTRKAGIYVRELTRAMLWVHKRGRGSEHGYSLFNMTMAPSPSVSEYVDAIQEVSGKKSWIPSVPFFLLYSVSFVVELTARFFGIKQPISPVRVKKLVRSNYIVPEFLVRNKYQYKYELRSAFKEWKSIAPEEWLR